MTRIYDALRDLWIVVPPPGVRHVGRWTPEREPVRHGAQSEAWPWRANELDEIWIGSLPVDAPRYAVRSTPAERIARRVAQAEREVFAGMRRAFRYIDQPHDIVRSARTGEVFRVEVVPGSVAPEIGWTGEEAVAAARTDTPFQRYLRSLAPSPSVPPTILPGPFTTRPVCTACCLGMPDGPWHRKECWSHVEHDAPLTGERPGASPA